MSSFSRIKELEDEINTLAARNAEILRANDEIRVEIIKRIKELETRGAADNSDEISFLKGIFSQFK